MKLTNNEDKTSAEPVEGRAQTKENDAQPHTQPTQGGARVSQGLGGVRQTARARKQERFTALLHHLTIDLLRESYYALQRSAAPGIDGVRWQQYEQGWRLGLPTFMVECTVERIGRKPREECTYRRLMAGNGRWASLRWRTRLSSRRW